jgi:transcriptional regulator with XRE-family HTH domain
MSENKKEVGDLSKATEALNAAFDDAPNPPPHFEEVLETLADSTTGVGEEELRTRRDAFLTRLAQGRSLGELLRSRREAMGMDIEEFSRRSSWRSERLEELEANRLDLQTVDAERLGALLVTLGLSGLGVLEEPLRQLARAHLAIYESAGPVFGRSRKGAGSFERRRDLQHNVAAVDEKATARQVDLYLCRVNDAMAELLG